MELKNAAAVCLISMFSATLVLLIARSLDNQAAARLEPQLASIAEELQAIRTQGGIMTAAGSATAGNAVDDGLIVYYFHGNVRCPTCEAIESQTHDVVENDFADEFGGGEIVWKVLNYEEPASADLSSEFGIHMANVVLAKMEGGQMKTWKRLDQVWALVGDKPAFAEFIKSEIRPLLAEEGEPLGIAEETDLLSVPTPDLTPPSLPDSDPPSIPLPE